MRTRATHAARIACAGNGPAQRASLSALSRIGGARSERVAGRRLGGTGSCSEGTRNRGRCQCRMGRFVRPRRAVKARPRRGGPGLAGASEAPAERPHQPSRPRQRGRAGDGGVVVAPAREGGSESGGRAFPSGGSDRTGEKARTTKRETRSHGRDAPAPGRWSDARAGRGRYDPPVAAVGAPRPRSETDGSTRA